MTAPVIQKLLARRHKDDIFVSECKNGPTHTASHLRMDAWAMKRSWTNRISYGYEIKVNRQDFLRDEKWHNYLDLCNEFYFVCPSKLIMPNELPAEVGLLYVTSTGSRLYQKKKAARRKIEIPENLYLYLLICRMQITCEQAGKETRREYWQQFLDNKREDQRLGYLVSEKIRKKVEEVERENYSLKENIAVFKHVADRLEEMGVDVTKSLHTWDIRKKIDELVGEIPPNLSFDIRQLQSGLEKLMQFVDGNRQ